MRKLLREVCGQPKNRLYIGWYAPIYGQNSGGLLIVMDREPQARDKHVAVRWNRQMRIWGGRGGSGGSGGHIDSNAVSCLDVLKGTWGVSTRSLSGESLPDGLACMAVAWDKEKAYMFAGLVTSKKFINDIYEVNLSSLVCRKLKPATRSAPPPSERNHSAMIYWKRKLINFGGFTGPSSTNDLYVFDLDEGIYNRMNWRPCTVCISVIL